MRSSVGDGQEVQMGVLGVPECGYGGESAGGFASFRFRGFKLHLLT